MYILLSPSTPVLVEMVVNVLLHTFHNLSNCGWRNYIWFLTCYEVCYLVEFDFGIEMSSTISVTVTYVWDVEQINCVRGFGNVRAFSHLPLAGMSSFLFFTLTCPNYSLDGFAPMIYLSFFYRTNSVSDAKKVSGPISHTFNKIFIRCVDFTLWWIVG